MSTIYDVIIAGAGPVGLFLACELALAKVSVLVLERDASPENPWKAPGLGGRGLNTASVEAFYRRGLLTELFGSAERPTVFEKTKGFQFAGHFAGITLDGNNVDFSRFKYHLPGPSLRPGLTTLEKVESVMSERLLQLGGHIQRGLAITDFVDDGQKVRVWSGEKSFSAQWLVGCDGGQSFIRKHAGFEFVGTEPEFTGYSSKGDLENADSLKDGFQITESGMYIKMPNRMFLFDYDTTFDRSQPISAQHLQTVLQRVTGTNATIKELRIAGSFTDRAKQVTQYRKGRVLLAGDSAHIHSPLGAQGLNVGIGDAMNLGWKLAATVQGKASPTLLDTYHQERHPVGAWVLDWCRAQTATLRPGPHGRATQKLIRDLISTQDGTGYFVEAIWGLEHRYELGESHPIVGRSAPDFNFHDGSRLGPKLERGNFIVVDFQSDPAIKATLESFGPSVEYVAASANETFGLRTTLVRPDGIVAWAAPEGADVGPLKAALEKWVGHSEVKNRVA